jgi:hypothetical protein
VGAVALGNVDILVRSGPEVGPYFSILMPDPLVGWRRAWFLLKNNADVLLPAFTSGFPSPIPIGSMVWLELTSIGCNPCWRSSGDCCKGD